MVASPQALITLAKATKRIKEIREAEKLEESFYEFVKAAWHVFDPADFVDNWHLEDICNHMQAVAEGNISRLLLNEPPRTGKTAIVSICFVPWVWAQRKKGPLLGPHVSFFYASYAEQLALEHSLKCRRLIESRWYQARWGQRFNLQADRNTKGHFENNKGGYRMASSVDARATGYGADVLCLPPGEKVLTSAGWLPIDDIVLNQRSVKIAGFNHDRKRLVWQDILQYEQNPGRDLVEIKFDGGSFRCTADHPVFVEGAGYIQAGTVKAGQVLRTVPGLREETGPQPNKPDMRCMPQRAAHSCQHEAVRSLWKACLRNARASGARKWQILFSRMPRQGRNGSVESPLGGRKEHADLQKVPQGVSFRSVPSQEAPVLQLFVQDKSLLGQARPNPISKLRGMWDALQARKGKGKGNAAVLLSGMSGSSARQGNEGQRQPALCSRRLASALWSWLDKGTEILSAQAGWLSVPRLRIAGSGAWDGAARPSYQLRQERYVDRQPDLGLPGLSRPDAREQCRTEAVAAAIVRSVAPAGYADTTFNLNVSPCHNYFVGGALVHNCADDPHLVKEAESDLVREGVVRWWSETMPSRLNNRQTGAMIVVMQRIHEGDLSGHILAADTGYVHCCVPMSYVPCQHVNAWIDGKIKTVIGDEIDEIDDDDVFWCDRRTEEGDLLWPERFPASEVVKLEKELGPYAFSGQYQQSPAPRGGGIIREEWWRPYDAKAAKEFGAPLKENGDPKEFPSCEYVLASLDTAYTEKEENDPSALSIWGVFRDTAGNPKIMLMFCWSERYLLHDLVSRVGSDCKDYKVDQLIIEDKAAGHSVSQELARLFGTFNFGINLINPRTGFIKSPDKVARLQTVVHLFAEGMIYAPDKSWADEMIKQCSLVPRALHDDLADTCSMALLYLRRAGWAVKREERALEVEDETRYRPRSGALYPA